MASSYDAHWFSTHFPELSAVEPLKPSGQKTVFRAEHSAHGRIILKVFYPNQSFEEVKRELDALKQFNPAVPTTYENGTVDTALGRCFWMTEECIEGMSLREQLQVTHLSESDTIDLGLSILGILVQAERIPIVHRDIKPDNIIMSPSGARLIDFGIARHLNLSSLTGTSQPFGKFTPGYAPREQFRNVKAQIDVRADLFGLGVTMTECLLGTNPFIDGAASMSDILSRVESVGLPDCHSRGACSAALAEYLLTLTQKSRHHRPDNATDAIDWLKQIRKDT